MSDRSSWLEECCPECREVPGARCRQRRFSTARAPALQLHCARGSRARPCPTCKAQPGEPCSTPSGREASNSHSVRLRVGRHELVLRDDAWVELEWSCATLAAVPFSGRAGAGGRVGTITLSQVDAGELVDVEQRSGRDELTYALGALVWDRFGRFAGQPRVRGTVVWSLSDHSVVIVGDRGGERFEEAVA